ncbi:MAG TPA: cupredoxin domain-containing protein [Longimicrobium sp.]|nr:cupredoxin domain-containing protein [Longimicrobium sp.]
MRTGLAALLLALSACGGGNSGSDKGASVEVDTARVTSAPAPPGDTTAPAPGAVAEARRRTVRVRTSEYRIEITPVTVPAGEVTFDVTNAGGEAHGVEIEGQGVEAKTGGVEPGGAATVTAALPPGTYEVYCPMETDGQKHRDRGMRTTITVR